MKLSRFITDHLDEIIAEWETFARTLTPAATDMSARDLRDHAKAILQAIALDIDTDQNAEQKEEKSKGNAPETEGVDSAASTHGALRQSSGFSMPQLTAEYRAMRATVLRLWLASIKEITTTNSEEMIRFNEAIDQALQESAIRFADMTARTRDTFLAILGHDLRSPLNTMSMAADLMLQPKVGTDQTRLIGARVRRSTATMSNMVNDLLEFARTQLGGSMPISRARDDMGDICRAAVQDARSAHPDCTFELKTEGNMVGDFDRARLEQLFSNLLNNAAQFHTGARPITIAAQGEANAFVVRVSNFGPVIPANALTAIFDPLVQLAVSGQQNERPMTSIGLGLFIAREITTAHGGSIHAESTARSGTTFTVKLPRAST